jgi:MFS family permease
MPENKAIPEALRSLTADGRLLFATRFIRLFAYGSLSVILVFYLVSLGLTESQTGLLLSLTLAGDVVVSLLLTTWADRLGRRRMLIVGAVLMAAAGLAFAFTHNFFFLVVAGTIGVISPSGNEVGPFLSIEQAALSHVVRPATRTLVFAWYTLAGSVATAIGALAGGTVSHALQRSATSAVSSYRSVVVGYAALGILLALLFLRLSSAAEVRDPGEKSVRDLKTFFGVTRSHRLVLKLSGLFALDAFAGGFVIQSFAAYWFYLRFGTNPATLGGIFFWANLFAGISALLASRLASRIGLVKTMVYTHLPSNILLILVPLMPTLSLAIAVLLLRFSISQMDVPTRQSYTMAVVNPEERSAAAGITGVARTTGAAISPLIAGFLFSRPSLLSVPFFLAGSLKIIYDLLLYRAFVQVTLPEEEDVNVTFSSASGKSKA